MRVAGTARSTATATDWLSRVREVRGGKQQHCPHASVLHAAEAMGMHHCCAIRSCIKVIKDRHAGLLHSNKERHCKRLWTPTATSLCHRLPRHAPPITLNPKPFLTTCPIQPQVRIPHTEATGPCKARALAAALWAGEEYVLQVDSHMRCGTV